MTRKVLHGRFIVQSNVKGPDALINRINQFLLDARENKIKNLSDDEIELSKRALIKQLMQVDLKLSDEVSRRWSAITDETGLVEFDRREKKIAALE
jgi:secreted Zn-dependent insulinase-like peptidase